MTKNTKSFFGVTKEPGLATIPEYATASAPRKELQVPNTFGTAQNTLPVQQSDAFMGSHNYNIITGGYQRKPGF